MSKHITTNSSDLKSMEDMLIWLPNHKKPYVFITQKLCFKIGHILPESAHLGNLTKNQERLKLFAITDDPKVLVLPKYFL